MNRLYTVMEVASSNPITVPRVLLYYNLLIFFLCIYLYNCLNILQNQFLIILVAEFQTVHILLS